MAILVQHPPGKARARIKNVLITGAQVRPSVDGGGAGLQAEVGTASVGELGIGVDTVSVESSRLPRCPRLSVSVIVCVIPAGVGSGIVDQVVVDRQVGRAVLNVVVIERQARGCVLDVVNDVVLECDVIASGDPQSETVVRRVAVGDDVVVQVHVARASNFNHHSGIAKPVNHVGVGVDILRIGYFDSVGLPVSDLVVPDNNGAGRAIGRVEIDAVICALAVTAIVDVVGLDQ